MTFQETMTAANNLDRIEAVLGHPIPGGTIDMKDISRHTLSFSEIQRIAVDIQRIEAIREADKNRS